MTAELISLRAFLSHDSELIDIIIACQLVPHFSWKEWTDGKFVLKINKHNQKIFDTSRPYIVRDLFGRASAKVLGLKSQQVVKLLDQNIIFFLGQDQILRAIRFDTTKSCNISPLSIDLPVLRKVWKALNQNLVDDTILIGSWNTIKKELPKHLLK